MYYYTYAKLCAEIKAIAVQQKAVLENKLGIPFEAYVKDNDINKFIEVFNSNQAMITSFVVQLSSPQRNIF